MDTQGMNSKVSGGQNAKALMAGRKARFLFIRGRCYSIDEVCHVLFGDSHSMN